MADTRLIQEIYVPECNPFTAYPINAYDGHHFGLWGNKVITSWNIWLHTNIKLFTTLSTPLLGVTCFCNRVCQASIPTAKAIRPGACYRNKLYRTHNKQRNGNKNRTKTKQKHTQKKSQKDEKRSRRYFFSLLDRHYDVRILLLISLSSCLFLFWLFLFYLFSEIPLITWMSFQVFQNICSNLCYFFHTPNIDRCKEC